MTSWREHLDEDREGAVDRLVELLSIPSVSTDPAHARDCERAAEWLEADLASMGFEVSLQAPDGGHPVVLGRLVVDEEAPTVSLYGHYDVQPPDPIEAWTTPPFEPAVEDGIVRARGATDNKGQHLANLEALRAHIAEGSLAVNVNVLIEGEEESGGETLPKLLETEADALASDVVVVSDTALYDPEHPAIVHALRGIVAIELRVKGPKSDLHSGIYGGGVPNPNELLARALAGLKDDQGRVTVPGFYDGVAELGEDERALLDKVPFDEAAFREETGIPALHGEAGRTTLERLWTRPTLEVNGLKGGYGGPGFKTVIPSEAVGKLSCRLVPGQDGAAVGKAVVDAVGAALPPSVAFEGRVLASAPAWYAPPDHPMLSLGAACLESAFGGTCLFIREGGSIPVVPRLERLGPVVLMGYGLHDENLHAPDEFFRLEHFHKGARAFGTFLERLARPT